MDDTVWTEVNILPASAGDAERLLTGVVAPLVLAQRGSFDLWHFFWEPELRLRFRWRDTASAPCHHAEVAAWLDQAHRDAKLASWTEAAYDGEAKAYGPEIWEAVAADWMSGSDLALAVIKAGKRLPGPRGFYWERREHLFANQLDVPEVLACLWQADARLGQFWASRSHLIGDVREAIGRFLEDDRIVAGERGWRQRALAHSIAGLRDPATPAP